MSNPVTDLQSIAVFAAEVCRPAGECKAAILAAGKRPELQLDGVAYYGRASLAGVAARMKDRGPPTSGERQRPADADPYEIS